MPDSDDELGSDGEPGFGEELDLEDVLVAELGRDLLEATADRPAQDRVDLIRDAADAMAGPQRQAEEREFRSVHAEPNRTSADGRRWLWAAAAAVAVAAVFAGGVVAGRASSDDGTFADGVQTEGVVEYAGPITGDEGREAMVEIVKTDIGRIITFRSDDLAVLPVGEYYEVWFVGPDDGPSAPQRVSAGTFHPDTSGVSNVVLTGAVDPAKLSVIEVTAEPADGDPQVVGSVMLRFDIPSAPV